MKKYEIMYIVKPTLGEEEMKKVNENLQNALTSKKANIIDFQELGQKELAYEINKFKSGSYFLFVVESENDEATKEFDRLARISNDIIRHLIKRIDK